MAQKIYEYLAVKATASPTKLQTSLGIQDESHVPIMLCQSVAHAPKSVHESSKVFLWLLLRALLQGILLPHSQIHTLGVHGS